jgi:hypothetical protein
MLTDELITKIGDGLDTMPPRPTSRREIDLLVGRIEAKIRAAQERGASCVEIAKQITKDGYPIKTSTLRVALQRQRKKEPGTKRVTQKKPPPGTSQHRRDTAPPPDQARDAAAIQPARDVDSAQRVRDGYPGQQTYGVASAPQVVTKARI